LESPTGVGLGDAVLQRLAVETIDTEEVQETCVEGVRRGLLTKDERERDLAGELGKEGLKRGFLKIRAVIYAAYLEAEFPLGHTLKALKCVGYDNGERCENVVGEGHTRGE
jgi:hypothetical protein